MATQRKTLVGPGHKILGIYGFLFVVGVFLFLTIRWASYRSPHIQSKSSYDFPIDKNSVLLKRLKNGISGSRDYYGRVTTTNTTQAGSFPWVNTIQTIDTQYMSKEEWRKLSP